jgi:hypothetical protein
MFLSLRSPRSVNSTVAAHLIVGRKREADAPRLSDTLKPSRDVDAITENVIAVDQDVPEIDPDPEQHSAVLRGTSVALGHHHLHSHCVFDGIDNRRKLKQHAIARGLDEAAAVFRHEGVGNLAVFDATIAASLRPTRASAMWCAPLQ